MAKRPVFLPNNIYPFTKDKDVEFQWFPGFSVQQKQRSIAALHKSAMRDSIHPLLEISSKSTIEAGVQLSAFNLQLQTSNGTMSVEVAYQGSKVFTDGGPFDDMFQMTAREAKKDKRLKQSGELHHFEARFETPQCTWPLHPQSLFYDWLYIHALRQKQNESLANKLLDYQGFTDIEFNPKKQFSCQARSAALYVALVRLGILEQVFSSRDAYIELMNGQTKVSTLLIDFSD